MSPRRRVGFCPSLPFKDCNCPSGSCSEVPGPHVLLSSYAACVISCGTGVLSSLSPFLGCPSGSSELGWGSVELLRTSDVHFSISECTLRHGYSMLCLSVALFPGAGVGCPLLSSRALWRRLRPLLCSSVCGRHCTGPTNARQSQWETVISCVGGQVFLVRLGGTSSAMRAVHIAAGCSMKEGSAILVSFWLRMLLSRGCWLSVTERSILCPLSSVRSCCRSVSSLWRTCCHPGGLVWMWRSRSSMRGYYLTLLRRIDVIDVVRKCFSCAESTSMTSSGKNEKFHFRYNITRHIYMIILFFLHFWHLHDKI